MNRKRSRKNKAVPQTRLEDFIRDGEGWALEAAYRLSCDREEARELVQETLFRIVRAWDTFDGSRPLEAWFLAILRNLFYDTRRAYSRKRTISLDGIGENDDGDQVSLHDAIAAVEQSAFDRLAVTEEQEAVKRTLRQLRKDHRKVLKACDLEGMKYREAAARFGIPVGTLRSRLSRARAAFRAEYRK
jgi:RNA polymerase sigma-70 factor (ECF subfamily)